MGATRATLKDVAERSGFALRTVKKVMSGDPSVRKQNRDVILRAAAELNYTPNRAASALGKQKQIRLAVVYSRFTDLYFPDVERGFHKCIAEFFDYGLDLEFHVETIEDLAAQQHTLEALVARDDIDGVVMQPVDPTSLNHLIDALVDSGKPVATFGTDAPDSKRLLYVSCNGYQAGRIAGQLMAREARSIGSVHILNASQQTQMVSRIQGFVDRLHQDYPSVSVVTPALTSPDDYYSYVKNLIHSEDNIAGIFCTDAHVVHAGQAFQDLNITNIPLIGFDLSERSASLMRTNHITTILDQRPDVFSYLSAKLLFEYLSDGKKPASIHYTPLYILTSECLDTI